MTAALRALFARAPAAEPRSTGKQMVGAIIRENGWIYPYAGVHGPLSVEQTRVMMRCHAAASAASREIGKESPIPSYRIVPAPLPGEHRPWRIADQDAGKPPGRVLP